MFIEWFAICLPYSTFDIKSLEKMEGTVETNERCQSGIGKKVLGTGAKAWKKYFHPYRAIFPCLLPWNCFTKGKYPR